MWSDNKTQVGSMVVWVCGNNIGFNNDGNKIVYENERLAKKLNRAIVGKDNEGIARSITARILEM